MLTGLPAYDADLANVGEAEEHSALVADLRRLGARSSYLTADLGQPSMPESAVAATVERLGAVDTLVVAHAHSRVTPFDSLEPAAIDEHMVVNVRATMLLVKAFVAAHDPGRGQGRIVLFVSGQRLGPMSSELAYAASKGALEALVLSLADELAAANITVNALNPGPTDTGLLSGPDYEAIRSRFPAGRWGSPDDAARAVDWLISDEASWVTGQVIHSEGGLRR